jgi:hypothetical protein
MTRPTDSGFLGASFAASQGRPWMGLGWSIGVADELMDHVVCKAFFPIVTGHSPSPSPSPTHSHSLSLALTRSHSHSRFHSLSLSLSLTLTLAFTHSPSHSHSHPHSRFHSLSLSLSLSLTPHPHSRFHSLSLSLSIPPWIFLFSPVPGLKCRYQYGSALFPSNETCCLTPEVACQKRLPPGNNLTHCCQRNSQSTPRELSGARPLSIAISTSI